MNTQLLATEDSLKSLITNSSGVVTKGNLVSLIDFSGLLEGDYLVVVSEGAAVYRALITINDDLPGGVALVLSNESDGLVFHLPGKAETTPILVRKFDKNGVLIEQYYQYSNEIRPGQMVDGNTVTIAQPSRNTVDFRVKTVRGSLTVNDVDLNFFQLIRKGSGIVRSGNELSLIDFSGLWEGDYLLVFSEGAAVNRALVTISDDLPGRVALVLSN